MTDGKLAARLFRLSGFTSASGYLGLVDGEVGRSLSSSESSLEIIVAPRESRVDGVGAGFDGEPQTMGIGRVFVAATVTVCVGVAVTLRVGVGEIVIVGAEGLAALDVVERLTATAVEEESDVDVEIEGVVDGLVAVTGGTAAADDESRPLGFVAIRFSRNKIVLSRRAIVLRVSASSCRALSSSSCR